MKSGLLSLSLLLLWWSETTSGFVVSPSKQIVTKILDASTGEAAFVPPPLEDDNDEEDDVLETLERRRGKLKRGRRKKGGEQVLSKEDVSLVPEEVFYEGPPAISEVIVPTVSVLTVVGIIPAIAAWSRQAWVRYKITTRRVRVTSGVGGNDMAEVVYPDVVEIRTARRLFGDGDMVLFLRDGARFELRNIPNFEEALLFILNQVDENVKANYKDVTNG